MSANFFTGLAQGFFDTRREQEMEQRKQDATRRQEYISVLGDLMGKADPASQHVLLGQIGDLMNLKGKERTMWDVLTGRGQYDLMNQLGGKFQEILGMVKSPQEYQQLQRTAAAERNPIAGMFPEAPQRIAQAKEQLPKAIGLRDPRAEEMERFQLQRVFTQEQALQRDRERAEARQEDIRLRAEMKEREDQNVLTNAVMNRARLNAYWRMREENPTMTLNASDISPDFITRTDWDTATTQTLEGLNLDAETKRKRLEVLEAQRGALTGGEAALDVGSLRVTAPGGKVTTKQGVATAATAEKLRQGRQRLALAARALNEQGQVQKAQRLMTMGGAYAQARMAYDLAASNLLAGIQRTRPELKPRITPQGIVITDPTTKADRPLTSSDLGLAGGALYKDQLAAYNKALPALAGARKNLEQNYPEQLRQMEQD